MRRQRKRFSYSAAFCVIILVFVLQQTLVAGAAPQQALAVDVTSASCVSRGSGDGLYTITGQVQNRGLNSTNQVRVIGTFYSVFGQVLANQTSELTNPPIIAPGLSGTFTLTATVPGCALVSSYKLVATTLAS